MVTYMIKKIYVKNINSCGEYEVDFTKSKYKYLEEMIKNDIVNPIAIYGTNGSGKTSFLRIARILSSLFNDDIEIIQTFTPNYLHLDETRKILIENNINEFDASQDFPNLISILSIDFELEGKQYKYIINSALENILFEELLENDKSIFKRESKNYILNEVNFEMENASNNLLLLRYLQNDEKNNSMLKKVFTYLSNISFISTDKKVFFIKSFNNRNYKELMVQHSHVIQELMSKYEDFPVYKIVEKNEITVDGISNKKQYFMEREINDKTYLIPYTLMSDGMINQSFMLTSLLSMPNGCALFVDEIEQSLHPTIFKEFINIVNEKNIQLIFSSHNTNILSLLRPDQIFFAREKDGFSTMKKLSNIYENIREVNNIEKMYLGNWFTEGINEDE